MLLEKAARDKKGVEEKKAAEEIEELHNKVGNYGPERPEHFTLSTLNIHGVAVWLVID